TTMSLRGEICFARQANDGSLRLAVIKGAHDQCEAAIGDWRLASSSPVSLSVRGNRVFGESSGDAHSARITLPPQFAKAAVSVDGASVNASRQGLELTVDLPGGNHTFTLQAQ